MLQRTEDGQAQHQHDQAAHDGHGAQHGVANGQALGQGVCQCQQAAGVAKRCSQGQQAKQQQAHTRKGRQQHAHLLDTRGAHAGANGQALANAAFRRGQPGKEVIGKLHQQRGGQHHHGDPHHLGGHEHGEVEIADQRCNQGGQHCQMAAHPGKHQPVAGGGGAVFIAMLGGFFQVNDLLALALLVDHQQHGHDQACIGQGNQAVQSHAGDCAGAGCDVHGVEHHREPGQRSRAPGQSGELWRGLVIDIQQAPGGAPGHQQAGADGQEKGRHKAALDPGIRHQLQSRGDGIDGAQAFDKDQTGQTGQNSAHDQHPDGQTRAAQAPVGCAFRRGKVATQAAQPDAQRKHQNQRRQCPQHGHFPAVLFNGCAKAALALSHQSVNALQVGRQVRRKLFPQRWRKR